MWKLSKIKSNYNKKKNIDLKSSVDKFYTEDVLKKWAIKMGANPKDLLLILSGKKEKVQKQLSELRLHLGDLLHLRKPNEYAPLWVLDFPLLEKDEESNRYVAVHHPFTSPKKEDFHLLQSTESSDLLKIRANSKISKIKQFFKGMECLFR